MATYSYTLPLFNPTKLSNEIAAVLPSVSFKIRCVNWNIDVITTTTLSAGDEATLEATVLAHDPSETLAEAIERNIIACKIHMADQLENVLLVEHPDASGKFFSITFVDQQNWHALYSIKDDATLVSYPYYIRTADEMDSHGIADAAEVTTIWQKVVTTAKAEIDACQTAVGNVAAASDIPSADAAAVAYTG